jgi:two-component system response regulator HydG
MREGAAANGKTVKGIAPEAMDLLTKYPWPGNVRELAAAVEGAVVLARGERITPRELPADVRDYDPSRVTAEPGGSPPPAATVKEAEKQLIVRALKEVDGNRTTAAQRIGISRRTLHRKLKEYGLENL